MRPRILAALFLALTVTPALGATSEHRVVTSKWTFSGLPLSNMASPVFSGKVCLYVEGIVQMCNDGTITVKKGIKADTAARAFIAELIKTWPNVAVKCHVPTPNPTRKSP